jgi:ribonuclease Y
MILIAVGAFVIGWFVHIHMGKSKVQSAEHQAKRILEDAEKDAAALKREKTLEAKDEWYKRKKEFELESQAKKNKLQTFENQLIGREENVDKKLELLYKKETMLQSKEKELTEKISKIDDRDRDLQRTIEQQNQQLENLSGLTRDEAKRQLTENLMETTKAEAAQMMKEIRDKARDEARRDAQKYMIHAIQRTATDVAVETTVSVINIQSDEIKGRIIGKEGRNIRAFEAATGVDVIVDDTPEAVILSAFDPFRREVARLALERLIADGRIHPARIEEVVEKIQKELEEEILRTGENTIFEVGLHGAHQELLKLIGRMKYRSSYGQNLLQHSVEVSFLCGYMASELGIDPVMAKRAGLLHDIGKTADKNYEGPHALIGLELCKKYNEHAIICNAVASHHDDIPMEHAIAALVQAADSISGARPGARREAVEDYIKRLEKLEALAKSFDGVLNTYAIQAGREVRVIVDCEKLNDASADQLSHDIAAKIMQELEYPGQIKVITIRERRSIAYAK